MRLADLIRTWRFREEMTQEQAAKMIGIPWNVYRALERGDGIQGTYLAAVLVWLLTGD